MSKYNQEELAIIEQGFLAGGFPLSRRKLIEIFQTNRDVTKFDDLKEAMRSALMRIESDSMTMEQISSVAHICAVVAYKLEEIGDDE